VRDTLESWLTTYKHCTSACVPTMCLVVCWETSDNFRPFNSSNCSLSLASIIIRYVPEYHNQHYLQATSEQALAQLPVGDMKEMPEMDQGMCTTLSPCRARECYQRFSVLHASLQGQHSPVSQPCAGLSCGARCVGSLCLTFLPTRQCTHISGTQRPLLNAPRRLHYPANKEAVNRSWMTVVAPHTTMPSVPRLVVPVPLPRPPS
jgi:hypothetical protein